MPTIQLHRYLGGRGGSIEIDGPKVTIDAPVFADPMVVRSRDVLGIALLQLDQDVPLLEPLLPQPQRTFGARLFHANLAIVFARPVRVPRLAGAPGWWRSLRSVHGLSLRVRGPSLAVDHFEAAGVPYLDDLEITLDQLRDDSR